MKAAVPIKRYAELLARYLRCQKLRFVLLAFLVLVSVGLRVVNPQIMRYFIDSATSGAPLSLLLLAALSFIAVAFLQQAIGVSATYTGELVAWTATNNLRADLAAHCLRQDMSFHNKRTPGELIERIEGDSTEISDFFSQLVLSVAANIIMIIGVLAALYLMDWRLGVAFTIFACLALAFLNGVRDFAVPHQKARP